MECFHHPGHAAAATCRQCGRAICRDCCQDLGHAVVCGEACATEAIHLREMNQRSKLIYGIGTTRRNLPSGVLVWGLLASVFFVAAAATWFQRGRVDWLGLMFGGVMTVLGVVAYRQSRRLQLNC